MNLLLSHLDWFTWIGLPGKAPPNSGSLSVLDVRLRSIVVVETAYKQCGSNKYWACIWEWVLRSSAGIWSEWNVQQSDRWSTMLCCRAHWRGTAAAVPPPFRPSDPALCGSRPL